LRFSRVTSVIDTEATEHPFALLLLNLFPAMGTDSLFIFIAYCTDEPGTDYTFSY
jgi:hypothetical protein